MSATKQVIQIEISTSNWKKIRISALLAWIASIEHMEITRLEVKEVQKRKKR